MKSVDITEISILETGELLVKPKENKDNIFQFIYRTATGVNWDEQSQCFKTPKPKEWSYQDWYENIISSVIDEIGIELKITSNTKYYNISNNLKESIKTK